MSALLICFLTSPRKHPSVSGNRKRTNAAPPTKRSRARGPQAEPPQRTPSSPYGGSAQPPAFSHGVRGWERAVLPCLDGQPPLLGSVHCWVMSTSGKHPLLGDVHFWVMFTAERCPLLEDIHFWVMSTAGKHPLLGMSISG